MSTSPAHADPAPSQLLAGEALLSGGSLISPNGKFAAVVQGDGNFVVYGPGSAVLFASKTYAPGASLVMQGDGNLVLYAPGNVAVFSTGSRGSSPFAQRQDDGKLVVYGSGRALWSSAVGRLPYPSFPGEGTFTVNNQIQPGTYRTRAAQSGCNWERLRGFSGEFADIIANNFTNNVDVVTIASSDVGFSTNDCATWTKDLSPITASLTATFGQPTS